MDAGLLLGPSDDAGTADDGAAPEAGAAADAGAAPDAGTAPPPKTAGCGAPQPLPSGTYQLDVAGTQRSYVLAVPPGYQSDRPYPLVFVWHGLGVTATEVAAPPSAGGTGYFGLLSASGGDALFVAGQGLPADLGLPGWPDTDGRDVAFARALLDDLAARYCIDEARVFSVGMSYGAVHTNRLGCVLGDRLRAIAAMSGAGPALVGAATPSCKGEVAVWLSHGTRDDVMPLSSGERSRDFWRARNHCGASTALPDANGCAQAQGCDASFPVVWCPFDGGHERPSFSPEAIWRFFTSL